MSFSSARERERGLNVRTWSQLKSFVDIEKISLPNSTIPPLSFPTPFTRTSRGGGLYILDLRQENRLRSFSFRSAQSYQYSWSTRRSASWPYIYLYVYRFEINFHVYCAIENSLVPRLIMISCKDRWADLLRGLWQWI